MFSYDHNNSVMQNYQEKLNQMQIILNIYGKVGVFPENEKKTYIAKALQLPQLTYLLCVTYCPLSILKRIDPCMHVRMYHCTVQCKCVLCECITTELCLCGPEPVVKFVHIQLIKSLLQIVIKCNSNQRTLHMRLAANGHT